MTVFTKTVFTKTVFNKTVFTKTVVVLGALLLALPMLAEDQAVSPDKAVFGYDTFDDIRLSIHHPAGADAAVYSVDVIADAEVDTSQFVSLVWWPPVNGGGQSVANANVSQAPIDSFYINDDWQTDGQWNFEVDESTSMEATEATK